MPVCGLEDDVTFGIRIPVGSAAFNQVVVGVNRAFKLVCRKLSRSADRRGSGVDCLICAGFIGDFGNPGKHIRKRVLRDQGQVGIDGDLCLPWLIVAFLNLINKSPAVYIDGFVNKMDRVCDFDVGPFNIFQAFFNRISSSFVGRIKIQELDIVCCFGLCDFIEILERILIEFLFVAFNIFILLPVSFAIHISEQAFQLIVVVLDRFLSCLKRFQIGDIAGVRRIGKRLYKLQHTGSFSAGDERTENGILRFFNKQFIQVIVYLNVMV